MEDIPEDGLRISPLLTACRIATTSLS